MKCRLVLFGFLLTATCCSAAPITIVFQAFHAPGWQAGYPYFANINGVPGVQVMCDDWAHGGLPRDTWQANFTDLGTRTLSLVRFNQLPNALTLYQEAGWLLIQTQVTTPPQWTDINVAVWYIFDNNTPLTPNAQTWLALAQQEANNEFPGVNFHQVGIYTPVNQFDANVDGPQELLQLVPEPGTLLLFAGGVMGVAVRRRIKPL